MRAVIVYDTWRPRGATTTIASWIAEELRLSGFEALAVRAGEAGLGHVELLVAGSPVYFERLLPSVLKIVRSAEVSTAVFVVCYAARLGDRGLRYAKAMYLRKMEEAAGDRLIESHVFKGWLRKPPKGEEEKARKWARSVLERIVLA